MLISTVNFSLYYAALRNRDPRVIVRSIQFRVLTGFVVIAVTVLTVLNLSVHPDPIVSFRKSFFFVATTISSTGYSADDYTAYDSTALAIMVLMMFVGGCSGSTAGGMKIDRFILMAKQALAQIQRNFRPAAVQVVRMGRAVINPQVLSDVTAFVVVYMACMGAGILAVTFIEGVPFATAFGAMLTFLSNMGPAPFHELAGLPDNFSLYSGTSKAIFCVAMLLGRLEFLALFALLVPSFWRR